MTALSTTTSATGPAPPPPPGRAARSSPPASLDGSHILATDHLRLFADAGRRSRPVRRASSVSLVSGWTMLVFALITLATGIFSIRSAALGLGLLLAAMIELHFSRRLRTYEEGAATKLAINQLLIGAALIAYAITGLVDALHGPGPYASYLAEGGQMAGMIEPIAQLHQAIAVTMYGGLMGCVLITQPCMAMYYMSRRRKVEAYRQQTPGWVAKALEAAGL